MPRIRLLTLLLASNFASATLAASFERPIPQAQTAAAELWFSLASIALCVALYVVHRVVRQR